MSEGSDSRSNGDFPPALHLQCGHSAQNEPLTPAQLLSLQLSRFVPSGAILPDEGPLAEVNALLASGAGVTWGEALDLCAAIAMTADTAKISERVQSVQKGRDGGAAARAKSRVWKNVVEREVFAVLDNRQFRDRRLLVAAVMKTPAVAKIMRDKVVKEITIKRYIHSLVTSDMRSATEQ